MTEFEMLLACYRSGQISERQWQEHLRDREFRERVMQKKDRRRNFPVAICLSMSILRDIERQNKPTHRRPTK